MPGVGREEEEGGREGFFIDIHQTVSRQIKLYQLTSYFMLTEPRPFGTNNVILSKTMKYIKKCNIQKSAENKVKKKIIKKKLKTELKEDEKQTKKLSPTYKFYRKQK